MDNIQKREIAEMVTGELYYMHVHPEINFPHWYLNLVCAAEQRLIMHDYAGAAHDIEQAIRGRYESMGVCL